MNRNDSLLMQEIVKQLKNDNLDMFDEFYDLTKNQVYVTILSVVKNKMTAEDIMQDTYLRFLNNIHKYKEIFILKNLKDVDFFEIHGRKLYLPTIYKWI